MIFASATATYTRGCVTTRPGQTRSNKGEERRRRIGPLTPSPPHDNMSLHAALATCACLVMMLHTNGHGPRAEGS